MAKKVKGGNDVRKSFKRLMMRIGGPMTEKALTEALIIIEGHTAPRIPVATSTLINSKFRDVSGGRGVTGFGAGYAKYVHAAPGTLIGAGAYRWPRRLGEVWDPSGEPQFLERGAEDAKPDIESRLKASYSL